MNKTQSIIFITLVLAVVIAGNWVYNNRSKKSNEFIPLKVEYNLINHDVISPNSISSRLNLYYGIKNNDVLELKYINDTLTLCRVNYFKSDSDVKTYRVIEYK
jgi:hypothetical protein